MVKEIADHQLVVIFTKENMDEDKSFPVAILSSMRCIDAPKRKVITGSLNV